MLLRKVKTFALRPFSPAAKRHRNENNKALSFALSLPVNCRRRPIDISYVGGHPTRSTLPASLRKLTPRFSPLSFLRCGLVSQILPTGVEKEGREGAPTNLSQNSHPRAKEFSLLLFLLRKNPELQFALPSLHRERRRMAHGGKKECLTKYNRRKDLPSTPPTLSSSSTNPVELRRGGNSIGAVVVEKPSGIIVIVFFCSVAASAASLSTLRFLFPNPLTPIAKELSLPSPPHIAAASSSSYLFRERPTLSHTTKEEGGGSRMQGYNERGREGGGGQHRQT